VHLAHKFVLPDMEEGSTGPHRQSAAVCLAHSEPEPASRPPRFVQSGDIDAKAEYKYITYSRKIKAFYDL
jgi:hypothetical protein